MQRNKVHCFIHLDCALSLILCVFFILIVYEKHLLNKKNLNLRREVEKGAGEQIGYLLVVYFKEEGLVLILDHLRLQLLSIWSQ